MLVEHSEERRLHFLLSDLPEMLIMRLMKYVAGSEPNDHQVLARGAFSLSPEGVDWRPDRLSYFVEPNCFNKDKAERYWCLINKTEALLLHREWLEDSKYTEPGTGAMGQNYFKNQVDEFKHQLETRTW